MKTAFYLLLFLHGAIHLLGFVKGFEIREVSALNLPISRVAAIIWLICFLGFTTYGILGLKGATYAWIFGLFAVLLSEALIIGAWSDAKYGTLANVLILTVALVGAGHYVFNERWKASMAEVALVNTGQTAEVVHKSDILTLPEPVQKWLERSGTLGKKPQLLGRLTQTARMKMKPDQQNWYPANAVQYTNLEQPAFVWKVDLTVNQLLSFDGRDGFTGGKGSMYIALNALIPVVRAKGPKIDEGAAQRFLGEMVWFPSFALSPYVIWDPIDDQSARATMTYKGTIASGTFYFSPEGDFIRFEALRYMENSPNAKRYPWILKVQDHATFDGIRVPSHMTATWKLKDGDWTWLELEVTDLDTDSTLYTSSIR